MCGIAGLLTARRTGIPLAQIVARMAATLRHRGPDDGGAWSDEASGIALGHRRLSIIDLSQEGHQPMRSRCGRYWMVYNGEVYNFAEIKRTLGVRGHSFRGHSDTEVVLTAFTEWGILAGTPQFNGMFAFAVWDIHERALWLGRDRVAEKPLYYGWAGDTFLFGSELKALRAHPDFVANIDRSALVQYLRFSYVPAPRTVYQHVRKLAPGTLLKLDVERLTSPETYQYWSADETWGQSEAAPFDGSAADGAAALERLLLSAVRLRMVADVPLGAFLSGGLDSSAVVALMQAQSIQPVKTFTIGFHEVAYNEAPHAKRVAQHLGTDHTELYVTPEEARATIPDLSRTYDEPFADPAQIPTSLLAKLARTKVTVSLSGDGGDELFGGYARYLWGRTLWGVLRHLPPTTRRSLSQILRLLPMNWLRGGIGLPLGRIFRLVERTQKASDILALSDAADMYRRFMSPWTRPAELVQDGLEPPDGFPPLPSADSPRDIVAWMMHADFTTYFQNDILVNVDRATMAVGLEGRIPFTDHRVIEFAWSLPHDWKLRGSVNKWLLRKVLYRYVPQALVDRTKMGFGVPLGDWLRGPLRGWALDLLSPERLKREGYLRSEPIQRAWREHDTGLVDWSFALWTVLMFEAWLSSPSFQYSPE
jgi:asparagine synthase (glutamine-hydrolysing)